MRKRFALAAAATSLVLVTTARAEMITWTLHDVVFDDGGTASGFVVFDPAKPTPPGVHGDAHLTQFDIKTTGGSALSAPFEFTPANTDASEPWYVGFFSAPEGPRPLHGLPQHFLQLVPEGEWPAHGGHVNVLLAASGDSLLDNQRSLFRATTSGFLIGTPIPEPSLLLLPVGLLMLVLRNRRRDCW